MLGDFHARKDSHSADILNARVAILPWESSNTGAMVLMPVERSTPEAPLVFTGFRLLQALKL